MIRRLASLLKELTEALAAFSASVGDLFDSLLDHSLREAFLWGLWLAATALVLAFVGWMAQGS